MNKIDQINFKGISNVGFITYSKKVNNKMSGNYSLSMVLSDDKKGKDLSEFRNVVKKIGKDLLDYNNNVASDIVNITCSKTPKSNLVYVNGNCLHEEDRFLPMFSFIAKMTRKISNMNKDDLQVDNYYKDCVANHVLIYRTKCSDNLADQKLLNFFFDSSKVKQGAKFVNNFIQDIMNRYLDVY